MSFIDVVAGARPNFMKIASLYYAHRDRAACPLRFRLVHTGQHYDKNMSGAFFSQLDIPEPDVTFNINAQTQAEQTGQIMAAYEDLLSREPRPSLSLVVGDVTSTMACSIVAKKASIPVAHIEAGIRSGDWRMPEEINRIVTDAISDYFFTTSAGASENLRRGGIREEQIFFVGNTMIDTLVRNRQKFVKPPFFDELGLQEKNFFTITLHRPSNVDDPERLCLILSEIEKHTRDLPLVFPVHPRTSALLKQIGSLSDRFHLVGPQPYLEFGYISANSLALITDSGGISEEATFNGVPCLTLRDTTERPETVDHGTNLLIGDDPKKLEPALQTLFAGNWKTGRRPKFWDGKTGMRILDILEAKFCI